MSGIAISCVVPVYNEGGSIAPTVARLDAALSGVCGPGGYEILVVDDGSRDGALEGLALPAQARLLRHPVNRGYGAALKTGIRQARKPTVLICDADGTYPLEELPRLAEAYREPVLVVARRNSLNYPRWHAPKILARQLLQLWLLLLTGKLIEDINSGFRLFSRTAVLPLLDELSDRFSFTTGLTLCWIYGRQPIVYVPTPYHLRAGQSKVNFLRDGLRLFQLTVRITWRRSPLRLLGPAAVLLVLAWLGAASR
ncbi:MAG: glycosyltransferase family 2 protein [Elusimicrobia bacterium]|nr:glycosyltransferase family 2 protein [Elusimicrobiota bacterium]